MNKLYHIGRDKINNEIHIKNGRYGNRNNLNEENLRTPRIGLRAEN